MCVCLFFVPYAWPQLDRICMKFGTWHYRWSWRDGLASAARVRALAALVLHLYGASGELRPGIRNWRPTTETDRAP